LSLTANTALIVLAQLFVRRRVAAPGEAARLPSAG
jgi:hypothetical protein